MNIKKLEAEYDLTAKEFLDALTRSDRRLKKIRQLINDDLIFANMLELLNGQHVYFPARSSWERIKIYRIIEKAFSGLKFGTDKFKETTEKIQELLGVKYKFSQHHIQRMLDARRYVRK